MTDDVMLAGYLNCQTMPLEERIKIATDVLATPDAHPHARAACWLAYRAIEADNAHTMIEPLETALKLNLCDHHAFLKFRWRNSLLMALAYCQIFSRQDPRLALQFLAAEFDALIRPNPTGFVNVCRGCVLLAAINRHNKMRADAAHRVCDDAFHLGIERQNFHKVALIIGQEMMMAARAMVISCALENGCTITDIDRIDKSQPFNRALTLAYLGAS